MTTLTIEAGALTASAEDRIVSGLLLPFGEVGNTNLGRVLVAREAVEIPTDLSILNMNAEHDGSEPRARFLTCTETPAGLVASFRVGQSTEGDELLGRVERARTGGEPVALSVELSRPVIQAGRVIKAKLSGAAAVARGAFPSAALFAADADYSSDTPPSPAGAEQANNTVTHQHTGTVTHNYGTPSAPAPQPSAPAGLQASAHTPAASPGAAVAALAPFGHATTIERMTEPSALLAAFFDAADLAQAGDPSALLSMAENAGALWAKFATTAGDVPFDSTGAAGNAARLPQWLGELWSGDTREREIIDLLGGTGELTSLSVKGWRFKTKPTVAKWDGNLANIASTKAETEPYESKAQRFAGGNSLAIEYQHFGEMEMASAILRLLAESYAEVSDLYALELVRAAAAANTIAVPIAPAHVPGAVARIVRGARRMRAKRAKVNFALVAEADYEEVLWTKEQDGLRNLATSFNLEEGQAVDSVIRPRPELAAGEVILVDRRAITLLELPGVPVRLNAADVARGGWDEALFGYVGHRIDYPAGIQRTTTAAA